MAAAQVQRAGRGKHGQQRRPFSGGVDATRLQTGPATYALAA